MRVHAAKLLVLVVNGCEATDVPWLARFRTSWLAHVTRTYRYAYHDITCTVYMYDVIRVNVARVHTVRMHTVTVRSVLVLVCYHFSLSIHLCLHALLAHDARRTTRGSGIAGSGPHPFLSTSPSCAGANGIIITAGNRWCKCGIAGRCVAASLPGWLVVPVRGWRAPRVIHQVPPARVMGAEFGVHERVEVAGPQPGLCASPSRYRQHRLTVTCEVTDSR